MSTPEGSRPLPDPDRNITPRKPRTPGGVVYLLVLGATLVGLILVVADRWRTGFIVMGGAMVLGAAMRMLLSPDAAGMLGLRRKLVDVATMAVLGGGLIVLATVIPDQPPL